MSEKKIVIPEGMLAAAIKGGSAQTSGQQCIVRDGLEAALRWLSENPLCLDGSIDADIQDSLVNMRGIDRSIITRELIACILTLGQSRMFLAPEPEVPQEITDLLCDRSGGGQAVTSMEDAQNSVDARIVEAFRRGQKAGSK